MVDAFADLPADVATALADPAEHGKGLLELAVQLPGLAGADASVAGHLRMFVLTWDPLQLDANRRDLAGFMGSSQHLEMRSCDGQVTRVGSDGDGAAVDAVAGTSTGSTA